MQDLKRWVHQPHVLFGQRGGVAGPSQGRAGPPRRHPGPPAPQARRHGPGGQGLRSIAAAATAPVDYLLPCSKVRSLTPACLRHAQGCELRPCAPYIPAAATRGGRGRQYLRRKLAASCWSPHRDAGRLASAANDGGGGCCIATATAHKVMQTNRNTHRDLEWLGLARVWPSVILQNETSQNETRLYLV